MFLCTSNVGVSYKKEQRHMLLAVLLVWEESTTMSIDPIVLDCWAVVIDPLDTGIHVISMTDHV